MKLKQFYIEGLFDLYNHEINFDSSNTDDGIANVIMIYGKNGVGKTTVLRMIDGLMTLNFDEFRRAKFVYAHLKFSNSNIISVEKIMNEDIKYLRVTYFSNNKKLEVKLHLNTELILNIEDEKKIAEFILKYRADLSRFSYEFIDTERLLKKNLKEEFLNDRNERERNKSKKIHKQRISYLNDKIRDFIKDSQINNSRYFHNDEPDLFDKILNNIDNELDLNSKSLSNRIRYLDNIEKNFRFKDFEIFTDNWNYKKIKQRIEEFKNDQLKLSVISAYINVHESRTFELVNLAHRLIIFEESLNEYLSDKKLSINSEGFKINLSNQDNDEIHESELSTGEYHLLYLTILALCTRVKGSVIAIDEPEMSMHITWQRKLIKTLTTIASNASPQMLFATHSPDIAENYINSLKTTKYEQL